MKYFGLNCEEEIANDLIKEINKEGETYIYRAIINSYMRGIIIIEDTIVHRAFDYLEVPNNDMTLKERLAYYYLLGDKK